MCCVRKLLNLLKAAIHIPSHFLRTARRGYRVFLVVVCLVLAGTLSASASVRFCRAQENSVKGFWVFVALVWVALAHQAVI